MTLKKHKSQEKIKWSSAKFLVEVLIAAYSIIITPRPPVNSYTRIYG